MYKIGWIERSKSEGSQRTGDETTYRHLAAFRQFLVGLRPWSDGVESYSTGTAESPRLPVRTILNYAALGLISIVFGFTAFGMINCRTPFFKVAVVFSASTLAGRSTILRIWFEQNSE